MARETVGIGMLGTGFIGQFHHQGLRHVATARAAACFGRDPARREAFAARNGYARAYDSIDAVCADPAVDLVIVSLPNELHVQAIEAAARHGKGVACTKPLGRTGAEAAAALAAVSRAGVWHGYLENVVFGVEMVRNAGAHRGGRHRPAGHLPGSRGTQWPARPALLGRADRRWRCAAGHGLARHRGGPYLFGKDLRVREAFAWG